MPVRLTERLWGGFGNRFVDACEARGCPELNQDVVNERSSGFPSRPGALVWGAQSDRVGDLQAPINSGNSSPTPALTFLRLPLEPSVTGASVKATLITG